MSEITRYCQNGTTLGGLSVHPNGAYMLVADHEAALAAEKSKNAALHRAYHDEHSRRINLQGALTESCDEHRSNLAAEGGCPCPEKARADAAQLSYKMAAKDRGNCIRDGDALAAQVATLRSAIEGTIAAYDAMTPEERRDQFTVMGLRRAIAATPEAARKAAQ